MDRLRNVAQADTTKLGSRGLRFLEKAAKKGPVPTSKCLDTKPRGYGQTTPVGNPDRLSFKLCRGLSLTTIGKTDSTITRQNAQIRL
jgi:hypothetical protein